MRSAIAALVAAWALPAFACLSERTTAPPAEIVYTGTSYPVFSDRGAPLPKAALTLPPLASLPSGALPWAGTVSHHLLTAPLIDAWFAELRSARDVGLFIIVSPRHWGQGVKEISLSGLSWDTDAGRVAVDRESLERLKRGLGCGEDPTAFPGEHGVGALVPFIRRHFPTAAILPVIVNMDDFRVETGARLARELEPFFQGREAARCFLLVSADFSHYHDRRSTAGNDKASRRFLDSLSSDDWVGSVCDNKTGLLVLSRLAEALDRTHCLVFAHTDSFRLTGREPDNITSYFFTFLH